MFGCYTDVASASIACRWCRWSCNSVYSSKYQQVSGYTKRVKIKTRFSVTVIWSVDVDATILYDASSEKGRGNLQIVFANNGQSTQSINK